MARYTHPEKYAQVEEDRRFLLDRLPAGLENSQDYVRIIDWYIEGTRLRLRRMVDPAGETVALKLGQKFRAAGQDAARTTMTNIYLNADEYALLATLPGAQLVKRRYPYSCAGNCYSIDLFGGHLHGLILAEIENRPGIAISTLPQPPFALREVTEDPAFTGGELVKLTRAEFLA